MTQEASFLSDSHSDVLEGVFAVLPQINIDTDIIFPKQFLKTVKKTELSHALFANWRFDEKGVERTDFILNQKLFKSASILVCGANFGCGSSREHAVWALKDFGILAVISSSFGTTFRNNCVNNGIWPLTVNAGELTNLVHKFDEKRPQTISVVLTDLCVSIGDEFTALAELDAHDHQSLLSGKNLIEQSLEHRDAINSFVKAYRARFPWALSDPFVIEP